MTANFRNAESMKAHAVACAAAGLLAGCATAPPEGAAGGDALHARVVAVLERRGLGADALSVIGNFVRHETPAPPYAPPLVRELLARPLAAVDAAAFFERSVPASLAHLAETVSAAPARFDGPPVPIREPLDVYLGELAEAQRVLRSALRGAPIDAEPILRELREDLPSAARLGPIAQAVDAAAIRRATDLFLEATARFVGVLRASAGRIRFPDQPLRFDSAVGVVSIGSAGDDEHGPDAAVIIDPGGNDLYRRSPATGGAISVIIDLGGNDRYRGSDVVVHGLSAIVDLAGNDSYQMAGPGIGAAITGASLVVDFSGDDSYQAELFGEGAAALGLGALIDLRGDDRYRLRAGGQGFGTMGGMGLLWDRDGNDTYTAAGLADSLERGGGVSMAQGCGLGLRTRYGGGIGILRDDSGDDAYEAQLFAHGVAYWYGAGLLWDRGGDDRYRAVRYAQGNGVHEAVGVLRDESGNDHYELGVGVGQGMGLDLAVGVLFDGAGDDLYQAPSIAQGSATANGLGLLIDAGGADRWQMSADRGGWGRAEWSRGLPAVGILIHEPERAVFERAGQAEPRARESAALGGPFGDTPVEHEPQREARCPAALAGENVAENAGGEQPRLAEALRQLLPGFLENASDPVLYESVRRRLTKQLRASVAELPAGAFEVGYSLGEALRCALAQATPDEAMSMWNDMEGLLSENPAMPFAGAFITALRERPPPAPQLVRTLRAIDADPRCGMRASALSMGATAAPDEASRATLAPAAQSALRSSCWRLQAQALAVLKRLGVAPDAAVPLPSFLRADR